MAQARANNGGQDHVEGELVGELDGVPFVLFAKITRQEINKEREPEGKAEGKKNPIPENRPVKEGEDENFRLGIPIKRGDRYHRVVL